jgi:probable HAF family extracellular repeat protein
MRRAFCSVALCLFASLALAQGTYTQIDPPDSIYTVALGIDSAGDIVGYYQSPTTLNGFLLSGGVYTILYEPDSDGITAPTAINNVGQIVGYYGSKTGTHGFLYDVQSATYTTIDLLASADTYWTGIDDGGTVVGYMSTSGHPSVGLEYAGGVFKKVLPAGSSSAFLSGINNSGVAVGSATTESGTARNFLLIQGKSRQVKIPTPTLAYPGGINDQKAIAGTYLPSPGIYYGFVYQNNTVTTLQFPGANNYTAANGINNAGEVVGYFNDATGATHGFTWTP